MRRRSVWSGRVGLVTSVLLCGAFAARGAARTAIDFNRDIRPILSDKCFACHGPDAAQRKAGLRLDRAEAALAATRSGAIALVPFAPQASELVRRIERDDEQRMPPPASGKSLSDEQRARLVAWVAQGADFATHWSFVPPVRPAVPEVLDPAWVRNPIDAFVLQRLAAEGVAPAAEASHESLLRRVSLDLTGLPPSVAEQEAFLADDAVAGYAAVVERLFASPRHGEHMARYWLDAARYGDTHGLHLDNERALWPWRDWVIEAFRSNLPYDRFVTEQLAGDLLPDPTPAQLVATGFNRCNITTGEGGLIADEFLARYAMDRVDTTATVFLGLTMHCAQCHDHKYDPFTQRDYYGMFAFFNSLDEQGSDENALAPPPSLRVPSAADRAALAAIDADLAALERAMAAPMPEVDAAQETFEAQTRERLTRRWQVLRPLSALSRGGAEVAILDDHSIRLRGENPPRDLYEIALRVPAGPITALRLEALVDAEVGGVGRAGHHNIVLTDIAVSAASAQDPLRARPVAIDAITADYSQRDFGVARAIDGDAQSGFAIAGGERSDRAILMHLRQPLELGAGSLLFVTLAQTSDFLQHNLGRLRLSASGAPESRPVAASAWWQAGPFDAESASGDLAAPGISGPHGPAAAAAGDDGGVVWRERADLRDEVVNEFPPVTGTVYLRRELESPDARAIRLALGSDDSLTVWLNGALVLDRDVARPAAPDQDFVTLQLAPGSNELLVRVVNLGGGFAFYHRVVGEEFDGLPTEVALAIARDDAARSTADGERIRHYFRSRHAPQWAELATRRDAALAERARVEAAVPVTMICRDRPQRRQAYVLQRGQYDRPGEAVQPDVPASLPPLPAGVARDRLALARWLCDPRHPLTARVAVNRLWQQVFGVGLVKTAEDFGAQGEWPSHQALLDWLACELIESGFDLRHLLRLIVTSATYRQRAGVDDRDWQRDPDNRLLARGARYRLDAEAIRDAALLASGYLVERMGGPSVRPYQPQGIWEAVAYTSSNTARFSRESGEALYRRSVYTFWKRTAPPPSLQLLDAPSREACSVTRARTNTPLQALALLNDEQFVEAARGLAERMLREGGDGDDARLGFGFRCVTSRRPAARELALLRDLLAAQRDAYDADPAVAQRIFAVGDAPVDRALPARELYAMIGVANVLLNLDEALTRG